MSIPIPIPRDLKPGDALVCNNGEKLLWQGYHYDGDAVTTPSVGGFSVWRPDGRSYKAPDARWIVAIERHAQPEAGEPQRATWQLSMHAQVTTEQLKALSEQFPQARIIAEWVGK